MTCDCDYPILPLSRIIKDGKGEIPNIEDYECPICGRKYKIKSYKGEVTILQRYDNTINAKVIKKYMQLMKQNMSDEDFEIFKKSINKSLPKWADELTTGNVSEMRTNNQSKETITNTGLIKEEQEISDLIVQAWNKFTKLEQIHPSDLEEVQQAIHMLQSVLAIRTVRRDYPNQWVSYKEK